jgi:ubiquinone/menaquinone biosynthesis C-methylase UbiE
LPASAFDRVAPTFDRHRALPPGVAAAVRAAIVAALHPVRAPRYLDVGAGTGRFGLAFVAAGDDYVGVDLSASMLGEFARHAAEQNITARLLQADAARLPFRNATFDAVLLMNVFGGLHDWRPFLTEVRRMLRPQGAVVVGRTQAPSDGLDARMKQCAQDSLESLGVAQDRVNRRGDVVAWLDSHATRRTAVTAARWVANRTPRAFIARHRGGARFSALPSATQSLALRELETRAVAVFGSLDSDFAEPHAFELDIFTFQHGASA